MEEGWGASTIGEEEAVLEQRAETTLEVSALLLEERYWRGREEEAYTVLHLSVHLSVSISPVFLCLSLLSLHLSLLSLSVSLHFSSCLYLSLHLSLPVSPLHRPPSFCPRSWPSSRLQDAALLSFTGTEGPTENNWKNPKCLSL